jgi:hypothetical protein
MLGWRGYAFAAAILISPPAMATTELHSGAGFAGAGIGDARAADVGAALVEGTAADQWTSAVDAAVFAEESAASPSASKADRFGWTYIMIAFMGLTAAFTGKRTSGRGLIAG